MRPRAPELEKPPSATGASLVLCYRRGGGWDEGRSLLAISSGPRACGMERPSTTQGESFLEVLVGGEYRPFDASPGRSTSQRARSHASRFEVIQDLELHTDHDSYAKGRMRGASRGQGQGFVGGRDLLL